MTKNLKRLFSGVLCFLFVMTSIVVTAPTVVFAADDLPEDILANKASFDTLDATIANYESQFAGNTPVASDFVTSVNGEVRLKRLNFIHYNDAPLDVVGEVTLDIPENIAGVLRLFGDIRLTGTLADNGVEMFIVDPDGSEHSAGNIIGHKWQGEYKDATGNPIWTTYTKMAWIQNGGSTITTPWDVKDADGNIDYSGYKLKLKGDGNLNFVYLWEETGMPTEYDTSAYGVIGSDVETLNMTVAVDTKQNLSINGVNTFDADVFKRYHVNSGPTGIESASGDVTLLDEAYHKTVADWGFTPGRGAFHFSLMSNPLYAGTLVEDSNRPGWSDFAATMDLYKKSPEAIEKMTDLYPTMGKDYIVTLDGWPTWTWEDPNDPSMSANSATPAYDKFDSAADTAAQLVKALDTRFDGLGPKYIEVKNESTISNEWNFLNTESKESAWDKLGEFHNVVADEIKAQNPDVQVGGPSSAFMYLERDNFSEARLQLDFMDDTKDHLDWYSHHFYENSTLYTNGRADNSDGFLSGRFEAVLDLLRAHMNNTDNVKPILITEEGSYNSLSTDIDYFQKLNAANGYFLRFMDYADTIDMLVPYLYPIINWRPDSTGTFFKYNGDKTGLQEDPAPMSAYLDMWMDFSGAYIPSDATCQPTLDDTIDTDLAAERVFTKAVRDGNKVYIAVHNLNRNQVNLDLDVILGDGVSIAEASRKHFFLEKGQLTYEEIPVNDLNNVNMRVQEMSVIEITLDSAPDFEGTLLEHIDYAAEELVPTGSNATFTINKDADTTTAAVLRVGFGKSGSGFDGDMAVTINGSDIGTRSLESTNKSGDVLTSMNYNITDLSVLQTGSNLVTVSMPEGGTISSVQLTSYIPQAAPTGVDTSELAAIISDAQAQLASVIISKTGVDVEVGNKWVTQEIYDTLKIELDQAIATKRNIIASSTDLEEAKTGVALASAIFAKHIKAPVQGGIDFTPISFEEGENPSYEIKENTKTEIVTNLGNTDGSQSLKYTVEEANVGYWAYKQLTLACSDPEGWDFSEAGFNVDITNPTDHKIQARIYLTEKSGASGFTWHDIDAGQTKTISITDFSPRANWSQNSVGYANGLNSKNITKVGICFNEEQNFVAGDSMIIDNLISKESGVIVVPTEGIDLSVDGIVTSDVNFTLNVASGNTSEMNGLAFEMKYDASKLEWTDYSSANSDVLIVTEVEPKDNTANTVGTLIVTLDADKALSTLDVIANFTFKVIEDFESTDIELIHVSKSNSNGMDQAMEDVLLTVNFTDLSDLTNAIVTGQALLSSIVEGYENNQYIPGAKEALTSAIDAANVIAVTPDLTTDQIKEATAALTKVMDDVATMKITALIGDINDDDLLTLGDLTIAASNYRVSSTDSNWSSVQRIDINRDGIIDIIDFTIIAHRIFIYGR